MNLPKADMQILMDSTRVQQTRLKKALENIENDYDYIVIDNAPNINMSVINALCVTDDVLVPIKIDKFTFDGLELIAEQIENLKDFKPNLDIKGLFITMYQKNKVNNAGVEYLREKTKYKVFNNIIRKTVKVDESTFKNKPLFEYARKSTATRDYLDLVNEYLESEV